MLGGGVLPLSNWKFLLCGSRDFPLCKINGRFPPPTSDIVLINGRGYRLISIIWFQPALINGGSAREDLSNRVVVFNEWRPLLYNLDQWPLISPESVVTPTLTLHSCLVIKASVSAKVEFYKTRDQPAGDNYYDHDRFGRCKLEIDRGVW